ncbi:MAG: DEAD/DEAH box helicase [Bacteriovoracaceae bacterium]|nr:DEAD/DEAH box helicase [Bacteriovoracaceae bacterium]
MSFESLELHPAFKGFFAEQGFKKPTQVQRQTIPLLINRKSVVVVSETGSGKTLAYTLPLFHALKIDEEKHGPNTLKGTPRAMILAPTRELANQIYLVMKSVSHHVKLRVRLLTGGDSHAKTKSLAHSTFDILIATPSRVKSSIKNKELTLGHLRHFILDEADNLFEMGFKRDIEAMLLDMDQTLLQLGFFTATLPPAFDIFLTEKFVGKKLERVAFTESHRPQTRIETYNVRVEPEEKNMVVRMFLEKEAKGRGIIFTNQKNQADEVHKFLKEKLPNLKVKVLHGDMDTDAREEALASFVSKKAQVLVATDVAARGIDIDDLAWVVNYGLPKSAIYYLHRCGRVGRGGKTGVVYNLVASHDGKMITEINQAIQGQTHLPLQMIPDAKLNQQARDKAKARAVEKVKKKVEVIAQRDRRARASDVAVEKQGRKTVRSARRGPGRVLKNKTRVR